MAPRNPEQILEAIDGAERIAIVGSPGAGKSTLARALAERTGLPLVHLDQLHWEAGWTEPEESVWQARVTAAAEGERWIIDGNYGSTFAPRLARADLVLWLDLPTALCLSRVIRRALAGWGRVRPDMAPGCPERLDPAFLLYVARFRRDGRRRLLLALERAAGPVIQIEHRTRLAALHASLGTKRGTRALYAA